jgi:hypothetical protein
MFRQKLRKFSRLLVDRLLVCVILMVVLAKMCDIAFGHGDGDMLRSAEFM